MYLIKFILHYRLTHLAWTLRGHEERPNLGFNRCLEDIPECLHTFYASEGYCMISVNRIRAKYFTL